MSRFGVLWRGTTSCGGRSAGVNRKHMLFLHRIVLIAHPEPKFNSDGWAIVTTFAASHFLNRFQTRLALRATTKAVCRNNR